MRENVTMLKKILAALGVVLVLLLIIPVVLPSKMHLSRSIDQVIRAFPASIASVVHPMIASPAMGV